MIATLTTLSAENSECVSERKRTIVQQQLPPVEIKAQTHMYSLINQYQSPKLIDILLNVSQKVVYMMSKRMQLLIVPNGGDFSSIHVLMK